MPTPEEAYAIVLAGAATSPTQSFAGDVLIENRKLPPNVPAHARRNMIEAALRSRGRSRNEINGSLIAVYDEMAAAGLTRPRNA